LLAVQRHGGRCSRTPLTGTVDALGPSPVAGHTLYRPPAAAPGRDRRVHLDDFTVIEPHATQPGSVTSRRAHPPITTQRCVTSGRAVVVCPLRRVATTSKTGRAMTFAPTLRDHPRPATSRPGPSFSDRLPPSTGHGRAARVLGWSRPGTGGCASGTDRTIIGSHRVAGLNLRRLLALGLTRTAST